jgi:hypothetical protein
MSFMKVSSRMLKISVIETGSLNHTGVILLSENRLLD